MANHPPRPYDTPPVSERPSAPTERSHPPRAYGSEGAANNQSGKLSWSKTGQQGPLGPTPARSPELTPPPEIE